MARRSKSRSKSRSRSRSRSGGRRSRSRSYLRRSRSRSAPRRRSLPQAIFGKVAGAHRCKHHYNNVVLRSVPVLGKGDKVFYRLGGGLVRAIGLGGPTMSVLGPRYIGAAARMPLGGVFRISASSPALGMRFINLMS